ncbi:hypothetical protein O9G_002903 [Rozella allomycis CSF55]|uniref:Integrase zinc-binding domain-containing protein n=1 Tax=Rozella allomycis (strain CSF55) TaxID=988480 RepID=A0A075B1C9_ROZAC|nr:hypothetical protein O9G_002903 [Rozella allomycis CSF55]|eukprot:EPZ36401.1 hypothetical protein O9G_002903 [Rozella allomycis CSF55]
MNSGLLLNLMFSNHENHDIPIAGHLIFKTFQQISERFYWDRMGRDVKFWIRSCKSCVAKKALDAKRNGLLKPILVSKPHEIVGLNFYGPLPKTKTGY